ncbi:MAG: hypothetical protein Q7S10_02700 [bacterium]|nr:hypothetical protein [bacterium]
MYFWKIEKLKNDLIEHPLSESEAFKYLFANVILYSLGAIPSAESNVWDVYSAIAAIAITIFGIIYAYKCNMGASGKNFLQKYLAIGWVVGVRWLALIALPVLIIYFTAIGIYSGIPEKTTPLDIVIMSILVISYFWLLGKNIKEVAKS